MTNREILARLASELPQDELREAWEEWVEVGERPLRLLELFAGSRSVGKIAEQMGFQVFSVDVKDFEGIDLVKDIEFLQLSDIPFVPDVIWASPPCTTYSIAAISHHRDGIMPKSEFAKKSDRLLERTVELIDHFQPRAFFIENPVGMMRKMPALRKYDRRTVMYCAYGDTRMKPTDIWTNYAYSLFQVNGWQPRDRCFNGNGKCHHEPAPRGSRTGTQGLKNDYERSKIPPELVREILRSVVQIDAPEAADNAQAIDLLEAIGEGIS